MALKAMLKTLEGLSDQQKALYRKEGDGDKAVYLLDVEPSEGWELTGGGLKAALLREREAREAADGKVKAFEGLDPAKAREALGKVDAMKNWTPEEKVNEQVQAKLKELAAQKDAEYAPKLKDAEATRKAYESLVIDKALEEAAVKHKFLSGALALPHLRPHVALVDNQPAVIGPDGKPRVRIENDGTTKAITIDEFVAEKAKDPFFAPLIAGNNATGTRGAAPLVTQQVRQPASPYSADQALDHLANVMAKKA